MANVRRVKNINVVDGIEFTTISTLRGGELMDRETYAPIPGQKDIQLISYCNSKEARDVHYHPIGWAAGGIYCDTFEGIMLRANELTDTVGYVSGREKATGREAGWKLTKPEIARYIQQCIEMYRPEYFRADCMRQGIAMFSQRVSKEFDLNLSPYTGILFHKPRMAKEELTLDPLIVDHYKHGLFVHSTDKPSDWLEEQANIVIAHVSECVKNN